MAKQQDQGVPNELDAMLGDVGQVVEAEEVEGAEGEEEEGEEEEEGDEESDEFDDEEEDEKPGNHDPRDAQIKLLTEQNAQLMSMFKEMKKTPEVEKPTEVDPLEGEQFTMLAETMNWDADEIGKFKSFFKSYADHINSSVLQGVMAKTPELVTTTLSKQQQRDKIATDFYSAYPELSGVREYVRTVANEVIGELGDEAPLEEVLRKTAKRAYKALGLKKKKVETDGVKGERQRTPAFPQQKGVRKKPAKKAKEVTDIDKLLEGLI